MTKRWSETQHLVARRLAETGWPYAEPVGNGRAGPDITGTPGLSIEVKNRKNFDPVGWLRQAHEQAAPDTLAAVVLRPYGMGPAAIDDWAFLVRFGDGVRLLVDAGYGGPDGFGAVDVPVRGELL